VATGNYASSGDPQRTMKLLWGVADAPTRGPKPALTVEDIVRAAVELADAEGLAAVSMRKVAERLGKSAMSLYSYVPGKAELLDLMIDRTLAEQPVTYSRESGWRSAVERYARDAWGYFERHPWVVEVQGARAVLGPHELDSYEARLTLFDGIGLAPAEVVKAVAAFDGLLSGSAKVVTEARAAEQATGQSDDDWWTERSPLLDMLSEDIWDERYPVASRLGEEHAFDQLDRQDDSTPYLERAAIDGFDFGLARLLDGIEAMIASRSPTKRAIRRPAGT
jgi:AcrR family transcriptional regulator